MATTKKQYCVEVFEFDDLSLLKQAINSFAEENTIVSLSHASRSTAFGSIYSALVVYSNTKATTKTQDCKTA